MWLRRNKKKMAQDNTIRGLGARNDRLRQSRKYSEKKREVSNTLHASI